MTEMKRPEVRLNLVLAIVAAAGGLGMRLLGAAALKKGLFLPEYATTIRNVGTAVLVIGVLWLGLTFLKQAMLPRERPAR